MSFLESLLWLTLNLYFEARSEPPLAQEAVAHVVINRAAASGRTIAQEIARPHQFSWTGAAWAIPDDPDGLLQACRIALIAMRLPDFTKGATFYHRDTVHPRWARAMQYVGSYGRHRFYRQTGGPPRKARPRR